MAKYQQYKSVLLKDGRIGAIVEVFEPDFYLVDVGHSPKDWDNIDVRESDIEREATKEEIDREYQESMRQLREQGILE